MSEWVSQSEITARLGYKILIAGLSEAGKTAVKRIFFLKQKTEDVDSLRATINYERLSVSIHGKPINIVDLGGQKIFLKRFLSSFSPFVFSSVKIFIFLIDVANKTSRNNAVAYFAACHEKLMKYSPNAEVFVFLHKNDLVRNSPNYENIHELLKEQFQLEYPGSSLRFFRTTIYKPETIIDSFGRIFELTIPEIAKSELVEERTIGPIEEYAKEGLTLRKKVEKVELPQLGSTPQDMLPMATSEVSSSLDLAERSQAEIAGISSQKMAGDSQVLEKLKGLMRQATTGKSGLMADSVSTSSTEIPYLGNAATEEMEEEVELTHVEEPVLENNQIMQEEKIETPPVTVLTPTVEEEIEPSIKEVDNKINNLMKFYNLERDHAEGIVKSGYTDLFETVAATGVIQVPLILDVLFKYIPFIRSEGLDIELLTNERLLSIFVAFLQGQFDETDFTKCLIFSIERPQISIDEIIEKYIVVPKIKAVKKEIVKVPETKPLETAHIDIPIETERIEGVIRIPETPLGFKVEIEDENIRISFHSYNEVTGDKSEIGHSTVSETITVKEISYLMAYELNMVDLGFFEGGRAAIEFSAKIVHEAIRQLQEYQIKSFDEIAEVDVVEPHKIHFIVPIEIEMEGDFLLLPDSENVAFTIERDQQGFKLRFSQRGFPIGDIIVEETTDVQQLRKILQEAMQLPINSDSAVDFAARVIQATLSILVVTAKISDSRKEPIKLEVPKTPSESKVEDDTSDQLEHYLRLLEKN
ncbi:MAG: ADP-ribosylation factor-like protein [Candidatus Hodarchaeota archaeon]